MQNTEADPADTDGRQTAVEVAVGVLLRGSGRDTEVFVARRAESKSQGGLLEFPGGKIEAGESPASALARELREELGIVFGEHTLVSPLIEIRWQYVEGERPLLLRVFDVKSWHGEPHGNEGQAAGWVRVDNLQSSSFPPANRGIIEALTCPRLIQVTPDWRYDAVRRHSAVTTLTDDLKAWQLSDCYERALPQMALLLRNRTIDSTAYARYLAEVVSAFQSPPSIGVYLDHGEGGGLTRNDLRRWLQSHSFCGSANIGAGRRTSFVHLSAGQCRFWQARLSSPADQGSVYRQLNAGAADNDVAPMRTALELPDYCSLSASVHSEEELWRSVGLGVDRITLSPVARTETHPEAEPLGWTKFSELAALSPVPCLALGGMSTADLDTALRCGGHGLAGIRGFGYPYRGPGSSK